MKTYLIDTENVSSAWLPLLPMLDEKDKLILFYTEFSCVLPYSALDAILTKPKQIKTIECERMGKNSLDFQLVSYLGYLIHKKKQNEYIIISNDKGFWSTAAFWAKQDYHVECWTVDQLQQYISMRTVPTQSYVLDNMIASKPNFNNDNTESLNQTSTIIDNNINDTTLDDDDVLHAHQEDNVPSDLLTYISEMPAKYDNDNKFKTFSLGTKINIAQYAYKLLASKIPDISPKILAKTAVIVCCNKELNKINSILTVYGMPTKQLTMPIKQCIGSIRKKINNHKKQKKPNNQQILRKATSVLIKHGIVPSEADNYAHMIVNTQKLSSLITQIKKNANAKTSKLIISVLPECYAA